MNIVESLTPRAGLRVLVTAGASGIGAKIATGFVEASGQVHISDVDAAAVAAATGGAVTGSVADAGDEGETRRLFAEAREAMGRN